MLGEGRIPSEGLSKDGGGWMGRWGEGEGAEGMRGAEGSGRGVVDGVGGTTGGGSGDDGGGGEEGGGGEGLPMIPENSGVGLQSSAVIGTDERGGEGGGADAVGGGDGDGGGEGGSGRGGAHHGAESRHMGGSEGGWGDIDAVAAEGRSLPGLGRQRGGNIDGARPKRGVRWAHGEGHDEGRLGMQSGRQSEGVSVSGVSIASAPDGGARTTHARKGGARGAARMSVPVRVPAEVREAFKSGAGARGRSPLAAQSGGGSWGAGGGGVGATDGDGWVAWVGFRPKPSSWGSRTAMG